MADHKFVASKDDDGTWIVLDVANDVPAVVDGIPQVNLTEDEARDVASTLNVMTDDGDSDG